MLNVVIMSVAVPMV